jgi:hypothetical protein
MIIKLEENSKLSWEMLGIIPPKLGKIFYHFVERLERLKQAEIYLLAIKNYINISAKNIDHEKVGYPAQYFINDSYVYDITRARIDSILYEPNQYYRIQINS